jgi:hypothetical protein
MASKTQPTARNKSEKQREKKKEVMNLEHESEEDEEDEHENLDDFVEVYDFSDDEEDALLMVLSTDKPLSSSMDVNHNNSQSSNNLGEKGRTNRRFSEPQVKVYECKLCVEEFEKSYDLANHYKSFHPKPKSYHQQLISSNKSNVSNSNRPSGTRNSHPPFLSINPTDIPTPVLSDNDNVPKINDSDKSNNNNSDDGNLEENRSAKRNKLFNNSNKHFIPYFENFTIMKSMLKVETQSQSDFDFVLYQRLESLKSLKQAYDVGLIKEEQFLKKQKEFVDSFIFK